MNFTPDAGGEILLKVITELRKIHPDLAQKILEELQETQREDSNIVLVGTDTKRSITIIHVDAAALNGEDGPVIFPTSDERFVLAAISRDFLEREVRKAESMEDERMADLYWDGLMGDLMAQISEQAQDNPQVIPDGGDLS